MRFKLAGESLVDRSLGETFREEREQRGVTPKDLAVVAHVSSSHLRSIENGNRRITAAIAEAYDKALDAGGLLVDLYNATSDGDEMRRRTVLALLGAIASSGVSASSVLAEFVRRDLLSEFGSDDWPDVASDYGRRFMTDSPAELRTLLARDLVVLRQQIRAEGSKSAMLAAPRLMLLNGALLANSGELVDGHRWYGAARKAAQAVKDPQLELWVIGRQMFRLGYEGAEPSVILNGAMNVSDVEAKLAVAQAYARLGERTSALGELTDARRLHDLSDQDDQTIYAMPAWRMELSSAYVYALLGDVARSDAHLDAVAPPPSVARWQAQRDMQRAVSFARAGDAREARELSAMVMSEAAPDERGAVLSKMCQLVGTSVPS